jgi:hypothetical protein
MACQGLAEWAEALAKACRFEVVGQITAVICAVPPGASLTVTDVLEVLCVHTRSAHSPMHVQLRNVLPNSNTGNDDAQHHAGIAYNCTCSPLRILDCKTLKDRDIALIKGSQRVRYVLKRLDLLSIFRIGGACIAGRGLMKALTGDTSLFGLESENGWLLELDVFFLARTIQETWEKVISLYVFESLIRSDLMWLNLR